MRLIDADALKNDHHMGDECDKCETKWRECQYDYIYSKMDFCTWIDDAPTIDAVEVVHGEWSNRRTWTHDGEWYCTACDKEITIYMGEKRGNDRYKYCPNCGAKMDGERREDDA